MFRWAGGRRWWRNVTSVPAVENARKRGVGEAGGIAVVFGTSFFCGWRRFFWDVAQLGRV
jgi:hypothetical protein